MEEAYRERGRSNLMRTGGDGDERRKGRRGKKD
jgi:hypothetical protein